MVYDANQMYPTPRAQRLMENARSEAARLNDEFIGAEHLFIAALLEPHGISAEILKPHRIDREHVYQALIQVRGSHSVDDPDAESSNRSLERFSIDLTSMAAEGPLDPVVGRDAEIRKVMQTLTRCRKNNPVVIGEAGVGKTAIVEGLDQRITSKNVRDSLKNRRAMALDLPAMVAGSKFGVNSRNALSRLLMK